MGKFLNYVKGPFANYVTKNPTNYLKFYKNFNKLNGFVFCYVLIEWPQSFRDGKGSGLYDRTLYIVMMAFVWFCVTKGRGDLVSKIQFSRYVIKERSHKRGVTRGVRFLWQIFIENYGK